MPTLASAATSAEILEALSRFLHWEEYRNSEESPPCEVMTGADAEALGYKPDNILLLHQDWLARPAAERGEHPLAKGVRDWWRQCEAGVILAQVWAELGFAGEPPSESVLAELAFQYPTLLEINRYDDEGEEIPLEEAVRRWRAIPETDRPPHPQAPLLEVWHGLSAEDQADICERAELTRTAFRNVEARLQQRKELPTGRMRVADLLGPAKRTWGDLSPAEQAALNDEIQAHLEAGIAAWRQEFREEGERLIAAIQAAVTSREVAETRIANIDRQPTGIVPAFAAKTHAPAVIVQADPNYLPTVSVPLAVYPPDRSGQFWMPGIPQEERDIAAFLLAILDAGSARIPGPGAPLRDRYFAEGLMLASREDRTGGGRFNLHQDDRPLSIADVVEWSGWNPKDYRPERANTGQALHRALSAVNAIKIPVLNKRGEWGWMHSVHYEAIEGLRLTDRIAASVRLWPGSEVGAQVDRTILRQAGKVSAIAWRLYLALCFEWNRIARNGRTPHLTRPEVMRDGRGRLLDADGRAITGPDPLLPSTRRKGIPRDKPATNWRDSRAADTGKREASPQARLYQVYDGPADLVRLAFPLQGAPGAENNPKRTREQAVRAVRWLAGERDADGNTLMLNRQSPAYPALRIERLSKPTKSNPDGFPWRVVPPETQ